MSAQEFRKQFPAPDDVAVPIAAFANANQFILAHAQNGASDYVTQLYPDGKTNYGRDFFFSGSLKRLREVRQDHEAIAVGPNVCFNETPLVKWNCNHFEFDIGMREIHQEAIIYWEKNELICETGTCVAYRITEAEAHGEGENLLITSDPEHNNYVLSIFLRKDGTPVMFTEKKVSTTKTDELVTSYVYDFNSSVSMFELPIHP